MSQGNFRSFLRESRGLSVDGAFEQFLEKEINITKATRSRASTSQQHIREFLNDKADRDDTFPRILSIQDSDFLGGSFARHTKNWPLDDIDIYFPLDGVGLFYSMGGSRLPYTVVSDGVLDANPLLAGRDRWMNGPYISSRKLIDGFEEVLSRHYHASKVKGVGEAVNVQLTHGEGEDNDGLAFDVVPAFFLRPFRSSDQEFYLIPDGDDGWIRTNPRLDKTISDDLNRKNGRTLRKAVKLCKWWNTYKLGGRLQSYYSELAVMVAFFNANQRGSTITAISVATAMAFEAVRDAARRGDQEPLVQGAPRVERGDLTENDHRRLDLAVERSQLAIYYESQGLVADASNTWRLIFGDSFPSA
jgi:hypothetical protein